MSTKTELELRPLEAHELDLVNGAGVHIQTHAAADGGPMFVVQDFINSNDRAIVGSKPVEQSPGAFNLAETIGWWRGHGFI